MALKQATVIRTYYPSKIAAEKAIGELLLKNIDADMTDSISTNHKFVVITFSHAPEEIFKALSKLNSKPESVELWDPNKVDGWTAPWIKITI